MNPDCRSAFHALPRGRVALRDAGLTALGRWLVPIVTVVAFHEVLVLDVAAPQVDLVVLDTLVVVVLLRHACVEVAVSVPLLCCPVVAGEWLID
jgi:hypothetical protein